MARNKSNNRPPLTQSLRERAEHLLQAKQSEIGDIPARDVKALTYELSVHHMELEIQNEELRQAQVELAQARDRYANLYEFAPVGYLAVNVNGDIFEVNLTAAEMLGCKRHELLQAKLSKFVARESQDEFYLHRQAVFSSAVKQISEIEMHRLDGTPLSIRLESVMISQGAEQHCQTVLIDISVRKKAEHQLLEMKASLEIEVAKHTEQLREEHTFIDTILNNLPATTFVLDSNGHVIRFNRACELATGYSFEELTEFPDWRDLLPASEQNKMQQLIGLLKSDQAPLQHEFHCKHKEGYLRLFSWNISVLKDPAGRPQYTICSGWDITMQREVEQKARLHLEEAARLQRILTANELATVLAHEINQPLAAISMLADSSQLLLAQSPLDPCRLGDNLKQITHQALRGGEIISGLRAVVKKGKIDPVALDLNAVIRTTCESMQVKARSRNIAISFDLDATLPPVWGVSIHIEQVLLNLLRNAIDAIRDTHTSGGSIHIVSVRKGNRALVTVRDSGHGIDEAAVNRLFDSFFSTKAYGLGVGLRISHSLILALGGRLWAEAHQPGGILHFELPFVPVKVT